MKKIVAVSGSPRRGNTDAIIEKILEGAKSEGANTSSYKITDMNIKGCQSCFYCRSHAGCSQQDDMQKIYDDLKDADAVVLGSPIYFFEVTGQFKTFFDRLFPLIDANGSPRFGRKKTVLVFAQGNPDPEKFEQSRNITASACSYIGLDVADTIVLSNGKDTGTAAASKAVMDKAFEDGKLLAAQ